MACAHIVIDGKRVLHQRQARLPAPGAGSGLLPGRHLHRAHDEALREDIELSMAMGFNGARLHEKVFEARFLYWADGWVTCLG